MNLKQSIDKILHQWPAKVICLIIAIFLYVFHQVSLIDKKTFVVPLTIQENGNVMHVGTVPNTVSVIVRTSNENMKFISANEISAFVNIDNIIDKGVYELPVNLNISDSLKTLDPLEVRLKDNKVVLEVDNRSFKYVKVQPSVVGDVSRFYEIENISITPSTVKITGPKSMIDVIQDVYTSRITVSNAETSFSTDVTVQIVNKLVEIEDDVKVKADVTVVPKNMELELDVPVDLMNLSPELTIEGNVPEVRIRLFGTLNYLENYHVPRRSVQALLGDIKEPGVYELPLYFYFPKFLDIVEKSSETITVTIVKKTSEDEANDIDIKME